MSYTAPVFLIVWCVLAGLASCRPAEPAISVEDAWSFPVPSADNLAVYATIRNRGAAGDRILSIHTPVADTVEIHRSTIDERGIMRMRPQSDVTIPARDELVLEPGGPHLMLVHVRQPLQPGETIPVQITFVKTGTLDVVVRIENR